MKEVDLPESSDPLSWLSLYRDEVKRDVEKGKEFWMAEVSFGEESKLKIAFLGATFGADTESKIFIDREDLLVRMGGLTFVEDLKAWRVDEEMIGAEGIFLYKKSEEEKLIFGLGLQTGIRPEEPEFAIVGSFLPIEAMSVTVLLEAIVDEQKKNGARVIKSFYDKDMQNWWDEGDLKRE